MAEDRARGGLDTSEAGRGEEEVVGRVGGGGGGGGHRARGGTGLRRKRGNDGDRARGDVAQWSLRCWMLD